MIDLEEDNMSSQSVRSWEAAGLFVRIMGYGGARGTHWKKGGMGVAGRVWARRMPHSSVKLDLSMPFMSG